MASLALGAIGAGVGSMFGFASIGWSIGSFIGGQLFGDKGQDIQGPRLTDKSISTSAYGNMRPVVYGSYRLGGEVIWSTDIKEHKHKEKAGKGGGGGGSYTTYTYTVSFAVALCRGPIVGVRKIWLDSKLVYSLSDDASAAEIQASGVIAKGITVYSGDTTQTPNSVMESYLGAGNVPGYRGTSYLVFEDLDVTKMGHLPVVTVEVVASGSLSLSTEINTTPGTSTHQSLNITNGVAQLYWSGYTYGSYADRAKFEQRTLSLADNTIKKKKHANFTPLGTGRPAYPVVMSPDGKYVISQYDSTDTNNFPYLAISPTGLMSYTLLLTDTNLFADNTGSDPSRLLRWSDDSNTIYFYKHNSGQLYIWVKTITPLGGEVWLLDDKIQVDATRAGIDPNGDGGAAICIDRLSGDIYIGVDEYISGTKYVVRLDPSGDVIETGKFSGINMFHGFSISNGMLWLVDPGGLVINVYDWSTEALIASDTISSFNNVGWNIEAVGNVCIGAIFGEMYVFKLTLELDAPPLSDVVSDICTSTGIAGAEIDVTGLASKSVRGFMISSQGPARGALEQLSAAFFFDGRESDGVFEFVLRGDSPSISLDNDDLGCYAGDDIQELWQAERMQEEELPRALTLNYANIEADYQVGAQHSLRQSVLNGTESTIQLPIALTDTEAKKIIDTMMFTAWQNRHKFTLRTWQSFNRIDPADVISAAGETLRVISRDEGVDGIIDIVGVRELPEIYTGQVGSAAPSGYTNQTVAVLGPTDSILLDIPPLRDQDYATNGFYWVANGLLDEWPGAVLLRSPDGDTWNAENTADVGSAIGQATTVLGDFFGGNIFDETNVVRVQVVGTLESKTEAQVLDGGNIAVLGNELIQFKNATLVSSGIYDLSGLVRGRLGTEWAISSHALDERFAILDMSTTRFVDVPAADFNVMRDWGGLTIGDSIEDIDKESFTYAGNNLKPLAVVHPSATLESDNDIVLSWDVRTRYRWRWASGAAPSSDESSALFDVDIYTASGFATIIRSVTDVSNPWTYTSAMQVADFGVNQKIIHYRVRQAGAYRNSEWLYTSATASGNRTVLLMHMNGTNGSTVFLDVYGHAVSAFNNAQISTAQSMFGGASALFDGVNDYLSLADSADWSFGTGDFTIEFFVRPTSVTVDQDIIAQRNDTLDPNNFWLIRLNSGSKIVAFAKASGSDITSRVGTISLVVNTWVHVAIVRKNGSVQIYTGGVANASGGTDGAGAWPNSAAALYIGVGDNLQSTDYGGYIDELRITKGEAIYTANFTPPAAPFTE